MAATRWYFTTGTTPVAVTSLSGVWTTVISGSASLLAGSHVQGALGIDKFFSGTPPAFVGHRVFVSGPLSAQTIAGNVKGQILTSADISTKLGTVAVTIRLVRNDGTDYSTTGSTKWLIGPTPSAADLAAIPPQFSTATTNRRFNTSAEAASLPLTSQTAADGDRLVVELGVRDTVADASFGLTLTIGGTTTADLPEDNTTTTASYPWIEFDSAILMAPIEVVHVSDSVTARRYGDVTLTETAHVRDGGITTQDGITRLEGVLHVTDTLTAVRGTAPGGDLSVSLSELVHVSDAPAVTLTPLLAAATETVHVADTGQAVLPVVQTSAVETAHVTDQITAALTVLVASPTETIHSSETAGAQLVGAADLQQSLTQTLHVSESVVAVLGAAAGTEQIQTFIVVA